MKVGVVLALLAAAACGAPGPRPKPARHVLLVTIDTLRADRLGSYGSQTVSTPHLDRLAQEGARAADASAHTPLTRPSHVSLLTGLSPTQHGIRDNVSPALTPDVLTLAEVLRTSGFQTAAFVSSIVLSPQSGLNRGFDTYRADFDGGARTARNDDVRFLDTIQRPGDQTVADAIAWLREHRSGRTATWVHLYEPHDPYEPPEPYATRYAGRPYDGEVAWSDELVGRLMATLDELEIRDETLMIVTSDHGEGLNEHAEPLHGYFVYETTLRVPLIFRGPGVTPGQTLRSTVRTVDVMPTIMELLHVTAPPGWRGAGRSVAGALRGEQPETEVASYAESLVPQIHFGWSDLRALRQGRWKYILAPRPELYDLEQDPNELWNLAQTQTAPARKLRAALEPYLVEERQKQSRQPAAPAMSPELRERLTALGYVSSGIRPEAEASIDPKDKVEEYKLISRSMRDGIRRLQGGDFKASADAWRALLGRGIDTFEVNYYLGRALAGLRQHRASSQHFARAIELMPEYVPAYLALAASYLEVNDSKSALAALAAAKEHGPKDPRLYDLEGDVYRRLGQRSSAMRAYENVILLAPADALARVRLGELHRDAGDLDRAAALLRDAVKLDPANATYWNSLGMVLGASGRLADAEEAFRTAVQHSPRDAFFAYNLGLILQRAGRSEEAARLFERAVHLDPRFGDARKRLSEVQRGR
jgi:arylsulfatase A-like enzyme/Tfp pilus assembly protein PilF